MERILIIGYGNSLAGDDALGFYAVQKLVGSELPANVAVKYIHQLMPEHAEDISEFDTVIFIDAEAADENEKAGQFSYRRLKKEDLHETGTSAHEYTIDSILLAAFSLYGRLPDVYLITVSGKSFLTSDRLSQEVENRLPDVIDTVYSLINKKNHFNNIPVIM